MQKLFLIFMLVVFPTLVFSQNKIKFQYKLNEGDVYIASTNFLSSSELEVNNEVQTVKKEEGFKYKLKILHPKSDSLVYIKLTYLKILKVFYIEDETIVLDSDSLKNANYLETDSVFRNIGKGFKFEISNQGKIISIDSVTAYNTSNNNIECEKIIENLFLRFPKKDILKNGSWNNTNIIKDDIFNIYDKQYTFTEIKDETFTIDNVAKISSDKTSFKKAKDLFIYYNLEGKETGKTILEQTSCMIKELSNTQITEGTSEVRFSKDSGAIFSSPVKIKNVFFVKILKSSNNED